jgi:hypothetical protein
MGARISPRFRRREPRRGVRDIVESVHGAPSRKNRRHEVAKEETAGCVHVRAIQTVKTAKRRECEDCMKIGARWVHLRTCQECGGTRCCDSSPNKHASKHAHASGHPVIASAEPGERWLYCYPDDDALEY